MKRPTSPRCQLRDGEEDERLDIQLDTLLATLARQHASFMRMLRDQIHAARRREEELDGLRMENANLQAQLFSLFAYSPRHAATGITAGLQAHRGSSQKNSEDASEISAQRSRISQGVEAGGARNKDQNKEKEDDDSEDSGDNAVEELKENREDENEVEMICRRRSKGKANDVLQKAQLARILRDYQDPPKKPELPKPNHHSISADVPLPWPPETEPPPLPHTLHGYGADVADVISALADHPDVITSTEAPVSAEKALLKVPPKARGSVTWDPEVDDDPPSQPLSETAAALAPASASTNLLRRLPTRMGRDQPRVFMDADSMKAKVREHLMKKEVNVGDLYKKDGVWQLLARKQWFEYLSNVVIAMNALWIAVDADLNSAPSLLQADVPFQVAEHLFCLYFSFEWAVRFMAFDKWGHMMKDRWFMFESALVLMMVLETWMLTSVVLLFTNFQGDMSVSGSQGSLLRVLRLLRLNRAARIARVLTAIPELMVLVKGVVTAARSVFFTIALLLCIIYVFAVAFRELAKDTQLEEDYFYSVPWSMTMLLLWGAFPDLVEITIKIGDESPWLAALFIGYIFLASLTVMNMLIGVLVEMVSMVAAVEQEEIEVSFVKNKFQSMLPKIDSDGNEKISKAEFQELLAQPVCSQALQSVGVDVLGLIDLTEFIFMNTGSEGLSFPEIMEMVLNLRQKNKATVKDIVDLRKYIAWNLSLFRDRLESTLLSLTPSPVTEAPKDHDQEGGGSFDETEGLRMRGAPSRRTTMRSNSSSFSKNGSLTSELEFGDPQPSRGQMHMATSIRSRHSIASSRAERCQNRALGRSWQSPPRSTTTSFLDKRHSGDGNMRFLS